jgi:glucose/arabinose dehydrogenase
VVPWADVAGDKAAGKTFTMPTDLWLPSVGVCGLDVVTGSEFAGWKGDLVAGGLSGQSLDRFRIEKNAKGEFIVAEREELLKNVGRVRDVKTGPDGSIFVVLNGPDKVVWLRNSKEKARAIAPFEGKAKDASLEVKDPEVKKP